MHNVYVTEYMVMASDEYTSSTTRDIDEKRNSRSWKCYCEPTLELDELFD